MKYIFYIFLFTNQVIAQSPPPPSPPFTECEVIAVSRSLNNLPVTDPYRVFRILKSCIDLSEDIQLRQNEFTYLRNGSVVNQLTNLQQDRLWIWNSPGEHIHDSDISYTTEEVYHGSFKKSTQAGKALLEYTTLELGDLIRIYTTNLFHPPPPPSPPQPPAPPSYPPSSPPQPPSFPPSLPPPPSPPFPPPSPPQTPPPPLPPQHPPLTPGQTSLETASITLFVQNLQPNATRIQEQVADALSIELDAVSVQLNVN